MPSAKQAGTLATRVASSRAEVLAAAESTNLVKAALGEKERFSTSHSTATAAAGAHGVAPKCACAASAAVAAAAGLPLAPARRPRTAPHTVERRQQHRGQRSGVAGQRQARGVEGLEDSANLTGRGQQAAVLQASG